MKIKPLVFGILVLVLFLGTVQGFKLAGFWTTSGKTDASGNAIQPVAEDIDSIKGWMTIGQISTAYGIPLEKLITDLNLPKDTLSTTALKDLESETFSVDTLKTYLESGTKPGETAVAGTEEANSSQVVTPFIDQVEIERTITGNTTFQDLINFGLTEEIIVKILGGELPVLDTLVKTYANEKGLEFSTIKAQIQAELDSIK